jgi:hypothetical protein
VVGDAEEADGLVVHAASAASAASTASSRAADR